MKRQQLEIGAAIGVALLLLAPRGSAAPIADGTGPQYRGWPVVATVRTGRGDASAWDAERYSAITRELRRRGIPTTAIPLVSRAMLAHMTNETGRVSEYNFNVGNLMPNANWHGAVFALPGTTGYERAYPNVNAGVADYVASATRGTYGSLTDDLAAGRIDEPTWWQRLLTSGWGTRAPTASDVDTYNRILARLRAAFPG